MLDNWSYIHTLRICNTYYFSTATTVTRKRLNISLYLHCVLSLSLSLSLSLQKPIRRLGKYTDGYCRLLEFNYRHLSTIFWRNLKVNAARNLHTYASDTYVRPWKQGLELELSMAVRNVVRVCYAQCTAPALHERRRSFCPTSMIVIVDVILKPRKVDLLFTQRKEMSA
jgi:hypothetical protein